MGSCDQAANKNEMNNCQQGHHELEGYDTYSNKYSDPL